MHSVIKSELQVVYHNGSSPSAIPQRLQRYARRSDSLRLHVC